jgi:hypothetical protein
MLSFLVGGINTLSPLSNGHFTARERKGISLSHNNLIDVHNFLFSIIIILFYVSYMTRTVSVTNMKELTYAVNSSLGSYRKITCFRELRNPTWRNYSLVLFREYLYISCPFSFLPFVLFSFRSSAYCVCAVSLLSPHICRRRETHETAKRRYVFVTGNTVLWNGDTRRRVCVCEALTEHKTRTSHVSPFTAQKSQDVNWESCTIRTYSRPVSLVQSF